MSIDSRLVARALCALLATAGATAPPLAAQAPYTVRVGLVIAADSATIGSDGPIDVLDADGNRQDAIEGGRVIARPSATGLDVAGTSYASPVRLQPRAGMLQLNGRPYRGILELRRTPQGRLTVINALDLEEYLYGVVRSEMDPRWPPEVLKAQAIAARSLGLYWAGRYAAEGYDVRATIENQVYGGVAAEDPRSTAAVDATRGIVMTFGGRPVFAAYHTDSGGATENSEFVWGSVTPYLRGVDDPYARDPANQAHEWTLRLSLADLDGRLQRAGRPAGGLQRLEVAATSPTGRVVSLRAIGGAGVVEVRGTEFRNAVGPNVLRSTLFTIRIIGDGVEFAGRGFGHGVGMSQWGARGLAMAGRDGAAILRYYYTGVVVGPRP
jgi:stage II sporulation protein D